MPMFDRYVGIDYSGRDEPNRAHAAIQVYVATYRDVPTRMQRPNSRFNWSRQSLYEWLLEILAEPTPTIVGIDHAFSFPVDFLQEHGIVNWNDFLDRFYEHWPADAQRVVDLRRGNAFLGGPEMFRLTDRQAPGAMGVFDFGNQGGLQGAVATSTLAGIPWLRHIRKQLGAGVHFWPFDGFDPIPGGSVVAEVYPRLFRAGYPRHVFEGVYPRPHYLTGHVYDHHYDARMTCSWLRDNDLGGQLERYLNPPLTQNECNAVRTEGWMLGLLQDP